MQSFRFPRRTSDRRGYVLLMTLVLIALAGLALAGLARHSLQLAIEAVEAREDLQRRWGSVCCQQVILARAEEILTAHLTSADIEETPRAVLDGRLPLGDLTFVWRLADEDAKVNVNTLYREIDASELERAIRDLTDTQAAHRLRPDQAAVQVNQRPFQSWGHVFAYEEIDDTAVPAQSIAAATQHLTCWGSGRLNVRRAAAPALALIVEIALTRHEAQRFTEALAENPEQPVADVINSLGLRSSRRRQLSRLVTDRSTSYSLWLAIASPVAEQHELQLVETTVGGPQYTRFTW